MMKTRPALPWWESRENLNAGECASTKATLVMVVLLLLCVRAFLLPFQAGLDFPCEKCAFQVYKFTENHDDSAFKFR
jgi:hypothetical protein